MLKHRKDREADYAKDRANYALAYLQVEQYVRFLVDELATARKVICQLNSEIASVSNQTEHLEINRNNIMENVERGGYIHRREKTRTDITGGDA